jgi:hypothetical protein
MTKPTGKFSVPDLKAARRDFEEACHDYCDALRLAIDEASYGTEHEERAQRMSRLASDEPTVRKEIDELEGILAQFAPAQFAEVWG